MTEKHPSEAKMTDKHMRRKKSNKTVMRNLRKSWAELADMNVGQLILAGGDRTWAEILRRVEALNKSLKEAQK